MQTFTEMELVVLTEWSLSIYGGGGGIKLVQDSHCEVKLFRWMLDFAFVFIFFMFIDTKYPVVWQESVLRRLETEEKTWEEKLQTSQSELQKVRKTEFRCS